MRPASEVWRDAQRNFWKKNNPRNYENADTEAERLRVADKAAAAIIDQDRAALVAEVFDWLIQRSQEPEEFLPGTYVTRLHAEERTAWLNDRRHEYLTNNG